MKRPLPVMKRQRQPTCWDFGRLIFPLLLVIVQLTPSHSFVVTPPFPTTPIRTQHWTPTSQTITPSSTTTVLWANKNKNKKKGKPKSNIICVNRVARRNYEVLETYEVGISLVGTEVKSIRDGKMNLRDGYVRPTKDGRSCLLYNVHIGKHSMSGEYFQHEERRERRLLVHKSEARKFLQQTDQKGFTIVPLKAYFNDQNKVKLEIGLCRGKNVRDKRDDIKNREAKREEQRIIKSFRV